MKNNIDGIKELWLPDKEKCTAQSELRRIEEWRRVNGGTKRPSQLGIESYHYGNQLPAKFLEGRNPPPVALDSVENLEWYGEQLRRCVHGFEYQGIRITGDHYWFLNFTPFLVAKKNKYGEVTTNIDIDFPYFSYQHDYIFKLIEEAHSLGKGFMWMAGRAVGKQQPDTEPVMTPTGPKPMGDILPGDYVIGSKGDKIKVLQIHPQGVDDVYEVILKDGRKIRCGLEHLWEVYDVKGNLRTLELKEMLAAGISFSTNTGSRVRNYNKYFIPTGNGANYSEKTFKLQPYTLGALLGGGSFNKHGTRLVIVDSERQILDHIINIENLVSTDYSDNHNNTKHGVGFSRIFFKKSSGITTKIKNLGLAGVKTKQKFIPKEYMFGSRHQRLELLRGLCDSDGYINNSGKIEFTNSSYNLAKDVVSLARSLGIKTKLKKSVRYGKLTIYRVYMNTGLPIFLLDRKRKKINTTPNNRVAKHRDRTAIVDIKKLDYKEKSTCLTVDAEDSLYLTTDYTVTHNTYMILSIIAKNYYLKPNSHNVVSASHSKHADEAFGKLKDMLLAIETAHPTLSLARLVDTKYFVKSGYEITIDGIKKEQGPMSKLQQVIYGDNPGVTRGSRPDTFLMEEVGDWSTGKGNLKECFSSSLGSWRIGSIYKTRLFLIGTGGSVASDQAKDLFTRPDGYNLLSVDDFVLRAGKKHCVFTPAHYLYGGAGWERTSVNNDEWSKKSLSDERKLKEEDTELHNRFVQEFPFTVEEVFKKMGTNIFHQRNIAKQWSDIQFGAAHIVKPEVGFLEWQRSKSGKINGVAWASNPNGNIEIVEHPYHGEDGKSIYDELYVMGVDSIDQGQLDSTTNRQRSSLAALVKKRIVDGEYFKNTSNLYVAKYIGRSMDVRDDYEEVLKLTMYYSAKVNVEFTKIGIVQYFREKGQWHTLMKRPAVAKASSGGSDPIHIQKLREQTLIGTTVSAGVIDYGDGKIKEYTRDYCQNLFFTDVLEQLRDYQREERTTYDLVIAMALCEIADEDMLGIPARESGAEAKELVRFGFFTNEKGKRQRGGLPQVRIKVTDSFKESNLNGFRWVDMNGRARFDDQFNVLDLDELEK